MKINEAAVVLLSGGLDSAVALAIGKTEGYRLCALTIDYGQRHRAELEAARRVAQTVGVQRHVVSTLDLTQWGGSALTSHHEVPTGRDPAQMGSDIPITYVPGRNTIFLSLAMAWAETLGSGHVFIGAHSLDYSGYPDCRGEYFEAFERMANIATRAGVEGHTRFSIHAPLINMTKAAIVRRGLDLGVPFALTVSCYQPSANGVACGVCDACILRRRAFDEVGMADPIRYAEPETNG